jgi:hypothetical protein
MRTKSIDPKAKPRRLVISVAVAVTFSSLGGALASAAGATTTTVTVAPNPVTPGDIPDTIAYVKYSNASGHYQFKHPEGWSQSSRGSSALFTDSYNGVAVEVSIDSKPPTSTSVLRSVVPRLRSSQSAFRLMRISPTRLPAGPGFLIVFQRNSPPNPVTNKSVRQEVHLYEIYSHGRTVKMSLFGAVGADNVDPYAKMSQSLGIR